MGALGFIKDKDHIDKDGINYSIIVFIAIYEISFGMTIGPISNKNYNIYINK